MYKHLAAAIAFALVSATPAFADPLPPEPQNFTLAAAIHTALRNNPGIQVAEAQVTQAKLDKEQADLWWANAVNANANYVLGGNQYGTVTATGNVLPTAAVGVGMNLGTLLNGPKTSQRAAQNVIIAEANLRKTSLEVATAVTVAYQEYQAAKQLASISGDMVQAAETDMRVVERTFERGASQANTLVGARLAVVRSRVDQVQGSGNVTKAWSNLLNVMGDDHWVSNDARTADRR
ncbi:MAG: outer membrane protein TolC [Cyanobacteria bacterium RYN_339]|nr:outer membrane protein TolC [Cyanobacteria bacterium RYN_339]